ncbi:ComF family protein [Streptomyces sp. NPDC005423]|uniref:ComF family protein n=1 Tax=Streptomyces sp. NPDC005423 TaxID=3155343 RepID=UPI0033BC76FE
MRAWWQDLTDLVLPAECGGCGRPRTVLCPECRAVLHGAVPRRVRPVPEPPGLPVVHAAAPYADEVRATLLAHKERGALTLAGPLGVALAGAVRAGLQEGPQGAPGQVCGGVQEERGGVRRGCPDAWPERGGTRTGGAGVRPGRDSARPGGQGTRSGGSGTGAGRNGTGLGRSGTGSGENGTGSGIAHEGPGGGGRRLGTTGAPLLLVPVPSAPGVVRARGHDPARRIAFAAAGELRRTGTPARVVAVLRQGRAVADQSRLGSRERLDNLAGALQVLPGGAQLLAAGVVVLVDDLMTTGASLTEAARAVREAVAGEGRGSGGTKTAGYAGTTREGGRQQTGESTRRRTGMARSAPEMARAETAVELIRAAVVAASPDSFEMNRN